MAPRVCHLTADGTSTDDHSRRQKVGRDELRTCNMGVDYDYKRFIKHWRLLLDLGDHCLLGKRNIWSITILNASREREQVGAGSFEGPNTGEVKPDAAKLVAGGAKPRPVTGAAGGASRPGPRFEGPASCLLGVARRITGSDRIGPSGWRLRFFVRHYAIGHMSWVVRFGLDQALERHQ